MSHHPTGGSHSSLDPLFEEQFVPFFDSVRGLGRESDTNDGGRGGDRHRSRQARHGAPSPQPGPVPRSIRVADDQTETVAASTGTTLAAQTRTTPLSRRVKKRSDPYKSLAQKRSERRNQVSEE
ncbi:hypothetical protein FRC19_003846 [Serendipita sp. 401]|nr:hypothetical protein FRC16_005736 [Serendipita sp. 398]KAG8828507.1 hypothetical protein FRC19_003846 [Serendipita sp. 401]KAG9058621.1 hypothetical protein FS842_008043 [Serendipita sp. 407]